MDDFWKFDTSGWDWIAGSEVFYSAAEYGEQGVPNPNNIPGSRFRSSATEDSNNFYLFGGQGVDISEQNIFQNDLWRYNGSWTWLAGTKYGAEGSGPTHRSDATLAALQEGIIMFAGESGFPVTFFNDVWLYSFTSKRLYFTNRITLS